MNDDRAITMLVNGPAAAAPSTTVLRDGFDRAARDFNFEPEVLAGLRSRHLDEQLATVAESGADLVIFWENLLRP